MKYIYTTLICFLFFGCSTSSQSIIKSDDELTAKIVSSFESYKSNDFTFFDQYSDDVISRINNTIIKGKDNILNAWKSHHDFLYQDINIEDLYVHTNYFADGTIWSNAWFTWTGKGQTTGTDYSNRGHFDYKWEDGKIVEVLAYFSETVDNTEIAAYTANTKE